ncbi:MAG: PadR family transcriptional regulator [Acidobacteria bacterium]|nr:PadR family transcriptional regulator [Acidobacteriota bacterium]
MTRRGSRGTEGKSQAPEPLTPAVFHILLALADGPLHGYAVMQAVAEAAGPSIATGPGTIYGAIARLQDSGLVIEAGAHELAAEPESTGAGRPRKYFRLTERGLEALRGEAGRLTRLSDLVGAKNLLPEDGNS